MKTIRAILLLHPGFEEMEAVAPIDLLVRAEVEVRLVSMTADKRVRGRSGIVLQTTHSFDEIETHDLYDAVILPGGPGISSLRKHPALCAFLRKHYSAGKILACICAAPLLLLDAELLPEEYTAHPTTAAELPKLKGQACVWDERILTSRGAGTATEFGLALIEALTDEATSAQIAQSICWPKE